MGQPAAAPLPSTSAESARVRSETAPEAEGSPPPSPAPQQLFVLVHGICGHARDFEVWEERLRACERPDWVVRISEKITPHAKFAGSEVCKLGEMLAGEVIDWVKELHIQAGIVVHFVCHSLGGLVARAALPKICEELDDELPSVSYGHFITLNTPHLGVRGANLWMCWKNMGVLIPTAAFSQIHQLTLQDRSGETPSSETLRSEPSSSSVTTTSAAQKPSRRFLESLADPQGRWCEALARFKYRTAVAASHWDVIVPFCTAAICSDNPFPSPNIFAGDFRTFWRVDAAVGFEAGSPLAKKNAEGGQVALEFEKSLSRPPVAAEGVEVSSSDEVALQSQPGDVLKLKTGRGWHVLRVEDVMLDLRVQRREKGEMVQRGFNDKTYAVETMGCQMNQADSERMEGQLQAAGLVPAAAKEDPDVIVLNTCSIRDKANRTGLDPHLQRKRRGEDVTIVVSGCVAQQEGETLLSAIPEVDVVVGPQYANRLADVLNESLQGGQICATADARIMEDVTMPNRQSSISAWVNVIYGCRNERCSYCVVPATRGSEQSRPMEAVKREVAQLTSEGYREVTLLGQNIDAWGRDLAPRRNFSELLRYVGDVAGLQRLRFLTSHPRYISDELIHAVRDVDAVCEQFHIPFQSGDDDVLRRMERGYTAERYRQIVRKIRQEVPNAGLSADAIVGFPGEPEAQMT
eukprot:s1883_g3.t1